MNNIDTNPLTEINENTSCDLPSTDRTFSRNTIRHWDYVDAPTSQEEICKDWIFDPMSRRTVNINPSFRNKKRKEEFDPLKFLMDKKLTQDCYSLEFCPYEDVEEEIALINSSSDKKRLNLLADGVLRKIAEHLENLNRIYNYRILDVHYEKVHCNVE